MSKHPTKILLVEDDEEDYMITKDLLSDNVHSKYQLEWVDSFDEGLRTIEEKNYDIFLIDYRLGKEEGLELMNQVSVQKQKTPFILLTGQKDPVLDQKAMDAGAADFLNKNTLTAELLDRSIRYSILQHKTLSELKYKKERLKEAQSLAHLGSYDWNTLTNEIIWTDELYRIFGYAPQSFTVSREKIQERIHPEDRAFVNEKLDWILREKKSLDFSYRIICPKRGIRHLNGLRKVELDKAGKLVRLFGSIQDVTELKRAEAINEDISRIVEESLNEIFIFDAESLHFIQVNKGARLNLGYSLEEIQQLTPVDIKPEYDEKAFLKKIQPLVDGNVPKIQFETIHQRKDQSTYPVEVHLQYSKLGSHLVFVAIILDTTEAKKTEQKLNNYASELEFKVNERTKKLAKSRKELKHALKKEQELGELKSRFVAMASHEFRTPLSTILSSAGLIGRYEKEDQQDKRKKHIERIKSSVKNLTSILNDFLSLEKLESNKIRFDPREIELDEFLEEILEEMKLLTKGNQSIKVSHSGASAIHTDPHLLKNILFNLLSNAIKYSPDNKDIDLVIENKLDALKIEVQDKGIGIPEADQKHMFSRFFRATNATTIKGTGLGLTIVKRYLDLMKGEISFTSKENEGTTFVIQIPLDTATVE